MRLPSPLVLATCLVALCSAPAQAQVVINEFFCGTPDYVELRNLGTTNVDISGWTLSTFQSSGGGTPSPETPFTFPAGTIIPAGQLLSAVEFSANAGPCSIGVGFNYNWTSTRNVEVALFDGANNGIDYVYRNVSGTPGTPNMPGGLTFNGALTATGNSVARNSDVDTDNASDWTAGGNDTPCGFNPGQNVPPPPVELTLSTTGTGDGVIAVVTTPALPGAEYLTLFSFENTQPIGSGPIFGLGLDVLPQFASMPMPGSPFRGFLDANGEYNLAFGPGTFGAGFRVQGATLVLSPTEILVSEAVEVIF